MSLPFEVENQLGDFYVDGECLGKAEITIREEMRGRLKELTGHIQAEPWMLRQAVEGDIVEFRPESIANKFRIHVLEFTPGQEWSPIHINVADLSGDI